VNFELIASIGLIVGLIVLVTVVIGFIVATLKG
jgi:hypothetical protein